MPGTHNAAPAATIPRTSRSTPTGSGPRSTRSPRNTAFRPAGGTTAAGSAASYPSFPSSSTSSSKHPCTSPTRSNGPWSSRRLFHSGCRTTSAASTCSADSSTYTYRNPSRDSPRSPCRSCDIWFRTTCGPNCRSARPRFRSWHTASGSFSTIATGSTSCRRASSTSGARLSACTFVASTTAIRPRPSRLPTTYCSTSNASPVAAWSFSSSLTIPRQKSDDTTSVALKCRRANDDFPAPLGPIRTTRHKSGMVIGVAILRFQLS